MPKLFVSLLVFALVAVASQAPASPLFINDVEPGPLTSVLQYRGSFGSIGVYTDVVGGTVFKTDYALVTFSPTEGSLTLVFHTNFPATGSYVGRFLVTPADVFFNLDADPAWDLAIVTYAHNGYKVGDVVMDPTILTSQNIWGSRPLSVRYAGTFTTTGSPDPGQPIPVKATGGANSGHASVEWLRSVSGPNAYDLTIRLTHGSLKGLEEFAFLWGTADCGNDTVFAKVAVAPVPVPPGLLLLGSGLAGLLFLGRRRKDSRR